MKWLRNLFVAFAVSFGGVFSRKNSVADRPAAPVEDEKNTEWVRGGTLAPIRVEVGRTIAGGPGSQKIGDTFDALPPEVRAQMKAARGRGSNPRLYKAGITQNPNVRQLRLGEDSDSESGYKKQRDLGAGISRAVGENYDALGRLKPKEKK